MKNKLKTMALAQLILASSGVAAQKQNVTPADYIDAFYSISVKASQDETLVSFDIALPAKMIDKDEAYVITPKMVNGDWTYTLPALSIEGARYAKVTDGKLYFKEKKTAQGLAGRMRVKYTGKEQTVHYQTVVPTTPEMCNASVYLIEKMACVCYPCNAKMDSTEVYYNSDHSDFASLKPTVYVSNFPDKEQRIYKEDFNGRSVFKVNQSGITDTVFVAGYKRFCENVNTAVDGSYGNIDHINIRVASSPEGPQSRNEQLAKKRAETLSESIAKGLDVDADMLSVAYESENWEDFITAVTAGNLENKNEILNIIGEVTDYDRREAKLSGLPNYRTEIAPLYRNLRNCTIAVDYTAFTDTVRMEKVFGYQPKNLGDATLVDLDAAITAYRQQSNDRNANNLLVAYTERGEYAKAARCFARISEEGKQRTSIATNAAVMHLLAGNYAEAEKMATQIINESITAEPDAEILFLRAVACSHLGDDKTTLNALAEACEADSSYKVKAREMIDFARFRPTREFKTIVK